MNPEFPALMARIRHNIQSGQQARKQLAAKLAELPIEQAAKLPRALLGRLAPDAMAVLARAGAGTNEMGSVPSGAAKVEASEAEHAPAPLWLSVLLAAVTAMAIALIAATLERPARWAASRAHLAAAETLGLCQRLDGWTEDCSYELGQSGFSLEEIAVWMGISVETIAAVNPDLPISQSLPSQTKVYIPRR